MKVRDVLKLLREDGWDTVLIRGDHRILQHPAKPGIVLVAGHERSDVPKGLLHAIMKQAGLEGIR